MWARGSLWKRRALPALVHCLHRSEFNDWSKHFITHDRGNLDPPLERRQHFSGVSLLSAILRALCKGVGFSKESRCHIRDSTLWDDQLAFSVMAVNASKEKGLPSMVYSGSYWLEEAKGKLVIENVQVSIRDRLAAMAREGQLPLPSSVLRAIGPEPAIDESQRPSYREDAYVITCPRASKELPIRQSYYDEWANSKTKGVQWSSLVSTHDAEFNPGGIPWKTKRPADTPLTGLQAVAESAIIVAPQDGVPSSKDELTKGSSCSEVQSSSTFFNFLVSSIGSLYVVGLDEGIIDNAEPLFMMKGRFRIGQPAKAMMDKGPPLCTNPGLCFQSCFDFSVPYASNLALTL